MRKNNSNHYAIIIIVRNDRHLATDYSFMWKKANVIIFSSVIESKYFKISNYNWFYNQLMKYILSLVLYCFQCINWQIYINK